MDDYTDDLTEEQKKRLSRNPALAQLASDGSEGKYISDEYQKLLDQEKALQTSLESEKEQATTTPKDYTVPPEGGNWWDVLGAAGNAMITPAITPKYISDKKIESQQNLLNTIQNKKAEELKRVLPETPVTANRPTQEQISEAPGANEPEQQFQDQVPQAPEYGYGLNQQFKGLRAEARAASELGRLQAKQLEGYTQEFQASRQREIDRANQMQNLYDKYYTEMKSSQDELKKVEPKDYWADKTTGSKIAAAASVLISGVGAAMSGEENLAVKRIDKIIADDLEKQKAKYSMARQGIQDKANLYGIRFNQFKDASLAEQAAKADMAKIAETQLETMKAKMASPIAKAKLDQTIGSLKASYEATNQRLATEQAKAQMDYLSKMQKEQTRSIEKNRDYYVPQFGDFATSKEGAQALRGEGAQILDAQDSIKRLLEIGKIGGKSMDLNLRTEAQQLTTLLKGNLRTLVVGPGAVSESEWKILNSAVADPTKFFSIDSRNRSALETLQKKITNKLNQRARTEGINPDAPKGFLGDKLKAEQLMNQKYGNLINKMPTRNPNNESSQNYASQPMQSAYGQSQPTESLSEPEKELVNQATQLTEKMGAKAPLSKQFISKANEVAKNNDVKLSDLLKVIGKESMFNPKARNQDTNATGLIQWLPSVAKEFKTTVGKIEKMDAVKQLDLVDKYLKKKFAPIKKQYPDWTPTITDVYAAIFSPKAVGNKDSTTLYKEGSNAYDFNSDLDENNDGKISKAEAAQSLRKYSEFNF